MGDSPIEWLELERELDAWRWHFPFEYSHIEIQQTMHPRSVSMALAAGWVHWISEGISALGYLHWVRSHGIIQKMRVSSELMVADRHGLADVEGH